MMRKLILLFFLLFSLSCSKSKPDLIPSKVTLVSPLLNEACTTGSIVSGTQSAVVFKWNPSENTSSYELVIRNLLTGASSSYNTSENTITITINQNTPYSWHVISRNSGSLAQSDEWKFYNSGPGAVTYAPFPAEILSPLMGENVTTPDGKVKLHWIGSDVDKDIIRYDIYFGPSVPVLIKNNHADSFLADVPVSSRTLYYWKVVSKDSKGNTSQSEVFQFKVN
ncbi:MAG: hypothetical protein WKF66_06805 [Pedobacter sp.]